jgi:HAD superfamily hydrolase (TIGR01509 family)
MTAILFGSIGVLADTSELQRSAFNDAFKAHGLDWEWTQQEYRDLLAHSGGQQRIEEYARARGQEVDAAAVHATKSERFQKLLAERPIEPRPGVVETIEKARSGDIDLALVTTTSRENITALAKALSPQVNLADFGVVVDTTDVREPKPSPEAYRVALGRLGADAKSAVAVEDNAGGVASASAAGIPVVAFPGENNAEHDFDSAVRRVDALSLDDLVAVKTAENS